MVKTNRRALVLVGLFLVVMVCTASGKVIYVDADAPGANNGSNWGDAYNYLQDALADANSSGGLIEIRVAQGIYEPDQGVGIAPGDPSAAFRLKNGWVVQGGYAGFGEPNPDARDVEAYETILSGDLAGNDALVGDPCDLLNHPTRSDNSYHVVVATGCGQSTVLDGFTVTGGNANGGALSQKGGGGVYDGKPNINNCKIVNNAAYYYGGGIQCGYAIHTPGGILSNSIVSGNAARSGGGIYGCVEIVNCVVNGNVATGYDGGGMYLGYSCDTTVTDSVISNNRAASRGGGLGIGASESKVITTRCTFMGNSAQDGGGIAVDGCTCGSYPKFYQCMIIGNTAGGRGGGMFAYGYSYAELHSCIFVGNSAGGDGGAMSDGEGWAGGSTLVNCTLAHNTAAGTGGGICYDSYPSDYLSQSLINSIVWYNSDSNGQTAQDSQIYIKGLGSLSINYCCIQALPGGIPGGHNIGGDPLFADADGPDNVAGNEDDDLHLLPGSPCIDSGDNGAVEYGLDLDGNARIISGRVNMGAYEMAFPPPILPGHEWRYFKGTEEPPANWKELSFDDSGWLRGPTGIGYGDGDDATVLDDMRGRYVSIYTRRLFYVENPEVLASVVLRMDYDDGFVAYINGVEIARNNVTGSPPAFSALADEPHEASAGNNNPNPPEDFDVSAFIGHLTTGMNMLAIQGHNVSLSESTDFSLIPSLYVKGILYVDDDAPNDPGPGDPGVSDPLEDGTQGHPFDAVQEAIDVAGPADTIMVMQGTYTGDGNRDIDFRGKAVTVRSVDPNDAEVVAATVVDCQGTSSVYHRGFHFHCGENANSVLSGFTIATGYAYSGGGIYCDRSSPTVANCVIRGNSAQHDGGGMCNWTDSSPTIIHCTFTENSAGYEGGGLYNLNGDPVITDCTFTENSSAGDGGGMQNDEGGPTLIRCVFKANHAGDEGGGISNEDTHVPPLGPVLINCLFIANSANYGGGMGNDDSRPMLANCTFTGNSAGQGGGIYNENAGAILTNCILWGDAADEIYEYQSTSDVAYSDVQGGWPGEGNMDADPYFANAANGDCHLKSQGGRWEPSSQTWVRDGVTSLCIDAGNIADPVGFEPFPNGGIINMGAYGGTPEASKSYFGEPVCEKVIVGDINGDCIVDWKDFRFMAIHWLEEGDR
jgi:hypothetical protein